MQFLDLSFLEKQVRGLMAWLCEFIYSVMGFFYELFNIVAKSNILTSEDVQPIYQRVTMILTIVMVFYVTFQFVKYVVQPDGLTDKEKGAGNIVYKMIIVIVLIAFVPKIFEMAYKVQNVIINENVISKVILGPQASVDEENLGRGFAASVFSMFYYVDAENANKECYDGATCQQIVAKNIGTLQTEGELTSLSLGLNETDTSDKALITFEFGGLLPVVVGAAITWVLMLYCIDVGVRWAQLLYLQLIAPIPILGYMSPKKDGIFQKWTKQCFTTYLDLFLRVAIINLMLLLCHTLLQSKLNGGIVPEGTTGMMATLTYIVLIMGVMLFAHKAPKMLSELFPKGGAASGNFGLKATERVAPEVARVAGAALGSTRFLGGAAARGINRRIRNRANGAARPWTKEGAEQKEKRKQNRNTANDLQRNYRRDTRENQRLRNRVTDAEVAAGKEKVNAARKEYEAVKNSGNQPEIDRKKAILDREAANYAKMMRERNAPVIDGAKAKVNDARGNLVSARRELAEAQKNGNQQAIAAATQKVQTAEQKYQAEVNKFRSDANKSGGRIGEINEAAKKVEEYENELNKAKQTGDQEKIDAAEKKLANAKINLESQAQRYGNTMNSDFATQKAELDNAWSQVATDNNTAYRSELGAAAWGAITGAVTGASEGFKAKKLEEIIPKAKEGWKKDTKNIQEMNKYYDNGGDTSFVGGLVDRTIAQVEKTVGVDTSYARINLENQSLERNIKEIDSSISRIDNVKKEFDATEDRLKSKIDDNKVEATSDTTIKTSYGDITIAEKTNYADVSRKYRAEAKNASAVSEAASKELQDKESKLGINKDTLINKYKNHNGIGLTAKEQQEYQLYQEYEQARKNAEDKSNKAVAAERILKEVDKNITRAIMTEMIKDKNYAKNEKGIYDGVAIQSLTRDYNEIEIAKQDPRLRNYLMNALSAEDYNAFISVNFKDYKQMDNILTALANAKSVLTMEKQTQQDQKHRNETSKATQAQKAASDYSGNSGK